MLEFLGWVLAAIVITALLSLIPGFFDSINECYDNGGVYHNGVCLGGK